MRIVKTNGKTMWIFYRLVGMRACTRLHDKLCTILYRNMTAVTKFIAKNNETPTSASR